MDFDLPGEDDERRTPVRRWLAEHPAPTGRQLAEAGYTAPHWPAPWGLDADPIHQLVIDDELRRAGVRRPANPIGIGWAGPTILAAGTDAQRNEYLFGLLSGEDIWCQLFSEPGAGSDLANLSTRAERDGDEWIVNGQKVWTSLAHVSRYGILIARTDPDRPKHEGITYFVCPMDSPGIEIRPIVEMTGGHTFNEVFLTDVRLGPEHVIGEVHDGWRLAKVTLANERVSLSSGGALWGMGPTADDLFSIVRDEGGVSDPIMRQRLAALFIESEVLRLIRLRTVTAAVQGREPGPEASIRKVIADEHGQRIMELAHDLAGAAALTGAAGPLGTDASWWTHGFLFAPALTVGGGTGDVQRNIIAERVLGLPHDIDVEAGRTWSENRRDHTPAPAEQPLVG
ncbi:MAG: acyl-CoA dehydrogenase [Actinobacteria bacterium]|nr:acyl-CoA dehydrogenase [Actinomycetota bacterium]